MKKLKLSFSNMEGVEVLTREQLKKVMGGLEDGSGGQHRCDCNSKDHCPEDKPHCVNDCDGPQNGKAGVC